MSWFRGGVTDRPALVVAVVGTGTEVGKTWVASHLTGALRARRLAVAVRKPVQSFDPAAGPTDADVLAEASGEPVEVVCLPHRSYGRPLAPFMAAALLGRDPFTMEDLLGELRWPAAVDVGLVESAGGVRSPITGDGGDTVDLLRGLAPDRVVLVADAGLGAINAVRLCLDALADYEVVVALNRFDGSELHSLNAGWLTRHAATPVVTDVAALAGLLC